MDEYDIQPAPDLSQSQPPAQWWQRFLNPQQANAMGGASPDMQRQAMVEALRRAGDKGGQSTLSKGSSDFGMGLGKLLGGMGGGG